MKDESEMNQCDRSDVVLRSTCSVPPQHFTSQREDFEGRREAILVWLTEMDLQLTNVEHFSQSDAEDKMRQLNVSPTCFSSKRFTHETSRRL